MIMTQLHDDHWINIRLLSFEEVKHCVKKVLEKEPFTTKKDMIGRLHHITTHRYMRHYNVENPIANRSYRLNGMKRVDEHNEILLKELYKEGYIRYEKHKGNYRYKGRDYTHYIIKLKD